MPIDNSMGIFVLVSFMSKEITTQKPVVLV